MRLRTGILLGIATGLVACHDPDNLVHHDIVPDTTVTSVRYMVNDPDSIPVSYPVPRDSSAQIDMDVDDDGVMDFRIIAQHAYHNESGPPPVPYGYFHFNLLITAIDSSANELIIYQDGSGSTLAIHSFYAPGQSIPYACETCSTFYQPAVGIAFTGSYSPETPLGDCYAGVRLVRNGKNYHGWIHLELYYFGIRVQDYTINLTDGNGVVAGQ